MLNMITASPPAHFNTDSNVLIDLDPCERGDLPYKVSDFFFPLLLSIRTCFRNFVSCYPPPPPPSQKSSGLRTGLWGAHFCSLPRAISLPRNSPVMYQLWYEVSGYYHNAWYVVMTIGNCFCCYGNNVTKKC